MNPNRMKRAKTRAKERAKLRAPGRRTGSKQGGSGKGIGVGELLILVLVALAILVAVNSPSYTHREIRTGELEKQYAPELLQDDLTDMMDALETIHPSIFGRVDREEIQAELQRIEAQLTAPMSRLEFYRMVAPLVARFGDARTGVEIPHEERGDVIDQGALLLPLEFDVTAENVSVLYNYSRDTLIGQGADVLAINGVSIDQLRTALVKFISGDTETYRYWQLGNRWRDLQWIAYGFESPFEVTVTRPNIRNGQVTRPMLGVPDGVIADAMANGEVPERTRNTFDYSFQSRQRAGYVKVDELRAYPGTVELLDAMLSSLEADGAASVVIDLRGTTGSDLKAVELWLRHLLTDPATLVDAREVRVSKQARLWYTRALPLLQRWYPPLFSERLARLWRAPMGSYERIEGAVEVTPVETPFAGEVFLLIDSGTGPSGVALATVLQREGRARVLGQEGAPGAYFFGEAYSFDMPNSRLRVNCPLERWIVNGAEAGIEPDLIVEPTAYERRRNLDSDLVRAISLAAQAQR